MVDRATIIIPIIGGVITAILSGSAINLITSAIYHPNIDVELMPDSEDIRNATIHMTNTGQSSAKDVKLTVEAPSRINTYSLFSTENYSKIHINSSTLELYLPRLSNGDGSDVRVHASLDPKSHMTSYRYIAYVTYDKGSKKEIMYAPQKDGNATRIVKSIGSTLTGGILSAAGAIITAFITPFIVDIYLHRKRDRNKMLHDKPGSISVIDFLAKLEKLKEHGIISEDELSRLKQSMAVKKNITVDDYLVKLEKLKEEE